MSKGKRAINGQFGFTLAELMVVVSIIAILIAILLPSLKEARHQARLVTCGSEMRQSGIALGTYAVDNRGFWPYRPSQNGGGGNQHQPHVICNQGEDDRPLLRPYVDTQFFYFCPFSRGRMQYDLDDVPPAYSLSVSMEMWYGRHIDNGEPSSGMFRVSQTPTYEGKEFNVLMGDLERWLPTYGGAGWVESAHPDRPMSMTFVETNLWGRPSFYYASNRGVFSRNRIDRNFVMTDGSVLQVQRISGPESPLANRWDDRLVRLPYIAGQTYRDIYGLIPGK